MSSKSSLGDDEGTRTGGRTGVTAEALKLSLEAKPGSDVGEKFAEESESAMRLEGVL